MQDAANGALAQNAFPLDGPRLSRLGQAVEGLDPAQLNWASGYLAGLGAATAVSAAQTTRAPALTILYASAGGNARSVAETLADDAAARGLSSRLVSADQYKARDLGKERLLYVVISTQGEGDPPESAHELFRYLTGKKPPRLEALEYAIFGLGDSGYEYFNQAARDLDRHLQALGATAVAERVDADVDYQGQTDDWYTQVLRIAEKTRPADEAQVIPLQRQTPGVVRHDRNHPYQAEVLENRPITTTDAVTAVHHLALEVDPEVIRHQPGDALGVVFHNDAVLVEEILALTGLTADAPVRLQDRTLRLYDALRSHLELTQLHPKVVAGWAEHTGDGELLGLVGDQAGRRAFAGERQLLDLLLAHPAPIDAGALLALLQPLQPRLYSIASSQAEYPDEVHLAVARVEYESFGRGHVGGASGHLTRRVEQGDVQAVYVVENNGFRLPRDNGAPVIMVGAGTGIAPFRAFLQQRVADGSEGHNWLVFGNRHFHHDFLYQKDWIDYRKAGHLERVSLAFSRDSDDRPYVQDRLLEAGAEIYRWLRDGAHFYVCGGLAMEKAVRRSLATIVETHAGLSPAEAGEFIQDLQSQGRYQKDAY